MYFYGNRFALHLSFVPKITISLSNITANWGAEDSGRADSRKLQQTTKYVAIRVPEQGCERFTPENEAVGYQVACV